MAKADTKQSAPDQTVRVFNKGTGSFRAHVYIPQKGVDDDGNPLPPLKVDFHLPPGPGSHADVPMKIAKLWIAHVSFGDHPVVLAGDYTPPAAVQEKLAAKDAKITEQDEQIKNLQAIIDKLQAGPAAVASTPAKQ